MANNSAFGPLGPTYYVDNAAPVQIKTYDARGAGQYRVRNLGSTALYFTYGSSNSVTSVGAPIANTPSANTIGLLPQSAEIFNLPPNTWMIASGASLEVTPGEGL